jgi:hypothetical protein
VALEKRYEPHRKYVQVPRDCAAKLCRKAE